MESSTEKEDSANPLPPSRVPTKEKAAQESVQPADDSGSNGQGRPKESLGLSDEALFLSGDKESLGVLVTRYQQTLYGLLVHVTGGDGSLAEDLFQEAFVRAVRGAKTFDRNRSFRSWITAIALNLVRDEVRKRKLRGEIPLEGGAEEQAAVGDQPPESAEQKDEAARIQVALSELTDKEKEIVLLHFYQSLTLGEAAEVLNVPLGTVKSRLHGALVRLKGLLRSERP